MKKNRIVVKPLLFSGCLVFFLGVGGVKAQTTGWQPSPGRTQIQIWPGAAPDAQPVAGPEVVKTSSGKDGLIAGKPVTGVSNVSRPTMTIYSPE